MNKSLFSSGWAHWTTPEAVLDPVRKVAGAITLDPCGNPSSTVGAAVTVLAPSTADDLGGLAPWAPLVANVEPVVVFVNPPYGREARRWTAKTAAEAAAHEDWHVIALLPARTDTSWWHRDLTTAAARCLWRGRVSFGNGPNGEDAPAPFPSVVCYWGPRPFAFAAAFEANGEILVGA